MLRFPRLVGARFVALVRADFAGVRAGFVALFISSGGDLVTGLTLASITNTLATLPGLVILIPAAIGMRGNIFGGLQTLFGGNITIYTELCEETRSETYQLMCHHADKNGANAIIGMRYDATEVMAGLTEVLCYGTAVIVAPE